MSVSNQKIIETFYYEPCDKKNIYGTYNLDALQKAMVKIRDATPFKLWLYLSKNAKGFSHLELSQAHCAEWGITKTSYYKAVEYLIKEGYLQQRSDNSNVYDFIQDPSSLEEQSIKSSSDEQISSSRNEQVIESSSEELKSSLNEQVCSSTELASSFEIGEILQDYIEYNNITLANFVRLKNKEGYSIDYEDELFAYITILDTKKKIRLQK